MSATTWCVVYNGGESAQVINDEGKTVYPGDFACARRSQVKELLDNGYLVLVDMDNITDTSSNASRMAKQEAQALNDKIDADKAAEEKAEARKPSTTSKTTSAKSADNNKQ